MAAPPDPPDRAPTNHSARQRHQPLRRNRQPRARSLRPIFRIINVATRWTPPNARHFGRSVADKSSAGEAVRPLEILTGGNPRLLTIIAGFGAGRSFRDLMENLLDLIDEHTEYFKSHLEVAPTPGTTRLPCPRPPLEALHHQGSRRPLPTQYQRLQFPAQAPRRTRRGHHRGRHTASPPVLPNRAPLQHLLPSAYAGALKPRHRSKLS